MLKICSKGEDPELLKTALEEGVFLTGIGELLAGRLHDHLVLQSLAKDGVSADTLKATLDPEWATYYTRDGRRAVEFAHDRAVYDEVRHSKEATAQALEEDRFMSAFWRGEARKLFGYDIG